MAKKMPRRLVALSASAIAAIYLAGFAYTGGADAGLASTASSVPTTVTASTGPSTGVLPAPSATNPAGPTATTAPAGPTATTAPAAAAYRDGTYTGTGTSRRGNVSVSITVQRGRIANVTISGVTTQYPVARIAGLPAQVVARQSGQVDNVSGATYSAQAFSLAVQAALSKAGA